MASRDALTLIAVVVALVVTTAITLQFYDRSWYPPDDGAYAHVADRILAGETLNDTVQDIHTGYINFTNAAALALFGRDLRSLRIPLAALNVAQSLLVLLLLRHNGLLVAFAASIAVASLSFVQFPNPSANWYCVFLSLLIPVLLQSPLQGQRRLLALGFIIGLIAMFRQLTGAIVAIATFGWLMAQSHGANTRHWLPRLLLSVLALLIAAYALRYADLAAALLFGTWPVALLLVVAWRTTASAMHTVRTAGTLAAGMALACLPLVAYHIWHGSLATWFDDVVVAVFILPRLPFISDVSFASLIALAAPHLVDWNEVGRPINALFWVVLVLLPMVNGSLALRRLWLHPTAPVPVHPLQWLAIFHSLVALYLQIPIYLIYTAGLNVAALATSISGPNRRVSAAVAAGLLSIGAIAVFFHAGQTLWRGLDGIVRGERSDQLVPCALPYCSLRLDPRERAAFAPVVQRVAALTGPSDCILALPADPEIYFLTDRCNPTRFFNSAIGLHSQQDVEALLQALQSRPPAMLIYRPGDKYTTALTRDLAMRATALYKEHEMFGEFTLHWQPEDRPQGEVPR